MRDSQPQEPRGEQSEVPETAVAPPEASESAGGKLTLGPRKAGRPKGTPNRDRVATAERIMELADPVRFWCDISNGKKVCVRRRGPKSEWYEPTIEQIFEAKKVLLRKVLPDLKATEFQGVLGSPLTINLISYAKAEAGDGTDNS